MRTRTWCVAMAVLSFGSPAMAQTVLAEADALARLSPDSPRVRAIRASIDLARAAVPAAARWPNPRVTFNRESVAGVSENMFTVTQALPITGRRDLDVSAASALVAASAVRADEEIRRARAELRAAYADLVAAQVHETELTGARDRLRALADVLARRELAGEAAGYARLRAEREVNRRTNRAYPGTVWRQARQRVGFSKNGLGHGRRTQRERRHGHAPRACPHTTPSR